MKRNIKIAILLILIIGLITSNLLMILINKDWLGGIELILGGVIAYVGKKIIKKKLDN